MVQLLASALSLLLVIALIYLPGAHAGQLARIADGRIMFQASRSTTNSSEMALMISTPMRRGWVAVALGKSMRDAEAWVVAFDGSGKISITTRVLQGFSAGSRNLAHRVRYKLDQATRTVAFWRPLVRSVGTSSPALGVTAGPLDFMYAYYDGASTDFASSKHTEANFFKYTVFESADTQPMSEKSGATDSSGPAQVAGGVLPSGLPRIPTQGMGSNGAVSGTGVSGSGGVGTTTTGSGGTVQNSSNTAAMDATKKLLDEATKIKPKAKNSPTSAGQKTPVAVVVGQLMVVYGVAIAASSLFW